MWIIIFLELITFGMALVAFVYYGHQEPEVFHQSRLQLNTTMGAINTVFLLTSGFFMATAVHQFKEKNIAKSSFYFKLTMLGGLFFLILKSIEYYHKIESGISLETNMFFSFYWMLTAFHLIHVIMGMVILMWTNYGMTKKNSDTAIEDVEACAAFWHMCDLIWLLLFPVLYLIF
jgi:nitric oxide reductase NorE protein